MATEVQNELLDVVSLLQAQIEEDIEEPTFESPPPPSEAPPSGVVELAKRSLAKSYVLRSDDSYEEPEKPKSVQDQFREAVNYASQIPKQARLELFNDFHQKCASYLIDFFYSIPLSELKKAIKYAQSKANPSLVNYAVTVALLHRNDAVGENFQVPSHLSSEPGMYFDMGKVTEDINDPKLNDVKEGEVPKRFVNINANFTGTNLDPEHKVAYFREDIGINLHHRHWHEVYPFKGHEDIIKKDRRGELFYYMHEQIVARYNFERFSNGLPRAAPYADFREPVIEAYFPKLDQMSTSNVFSSRPANCSLNDLHRETLYVQVSSLERWRDRIYDTIDRGYAYVMDKESKEEFKKKIDEETGINELVYSVEAVEILSWNYRYYGDLHNKGHMFISYIHDPDYRFQEPGSVMSHSETALRDPIFYRWHTFIDDIFQRYKRTLPSYTVEQRHFQGIKIESVQILPQEPKPQNENGDEDDGSPHVSNVLKTYWEKDAVDVSQGILYGDTKKTNEKVYAVFTHLQHKEFEYEIKVTNTLPNDVTGTVRIFMAPHVDESGLPMTFNGQRRMFIELDKFTAQLDSNVTTTIKRKSVDSSVTIPFEKSFMTLNDVRELVTDKEKNEALNKAANGYCGCGWPHHLLVGKGTTGKGMLCDLFVMITNYDDDRVDESPLHQKCCDKSSLSYCGVRNKKYPDRKPMGFPFDRDISNVYATINDFMTEKQEDFEKQNKNDASKKLPPRLSNMIVVPLRVRHEGGYPKLGKTMKEAGYTEETCKKFLKVAA
ncbi:phenoloxidase 2-like [Planococcus citri]|uniref:phenoloxidase 2-like n=1 Tax=Planococcus citri TaxID=170843 RepID=UPI0031F7EE69